jgi:hypothetical protein
MFKRRKRTADPQPETTITAPRAVPSEADLTASVEVLKAEIETLSEANRAQADLETERRLVLLRHLAGIRLVEQASGQANFIEPDADALPAGTPAGDALPEAPASELTAGLIRAGILRDGCLLVRGLVARNDALALAAEIDRAFAERDRGVIAPGYYEEFRPAARFGGEVYGRPWIKQGGGLLAADTPMLSFRMMEMFRAADLREIVSEYLGEPALISVHKTTLRKADPSVPGAWHQDGFFMGEVRSLNLWLSLSRCGDEAPGLDIVPRRLESYVATATEEAALDYTISNTRVQVAAGETPVIRPIFEPGDALFFDELFLHQTGSDPSMPKPRYAVENWFFGGSGFPDEYAPIAV